MIGVRNAGAAQPGQTSNHPCAAAWTSRRIKSQAPVFPVRARAPPSAAVAVSNLPRQGYETATAADGGSRGLGTGKDGRLGLILWIVMAAAHWMVFDVLAPGCAAPAFRNAIIL